MCQCAKECIKLGVLLRATNYCFIFYLPLTFPPLISSSKYHRSEKKKLWQEKISAHKALFYAFPSTVFRFRRTFNKSIPLSKLHFISIQECFIGGTYYNAVSKLHMNIQRIKLPTVYFEAINTGKNKSGRLFFFTLPLRWVFFPGSVFPALAHGCANPPPAAW